MGRPKKSEASPLAVASFDRQLQFEIESLPIASLLLDEIYQPRQGINSDVVNRYSEILADEILTSGKSDCPPVDVFCFSQDGVDIYYLVHGHHRYAAFKKCQAGEIPCKIYRGSKDDAIRLAMQANIFNGLQLTRKEVAIACRRYMVANNNLPEEQRESNRAIARRFLIDPKSVRNYQSILEGEAKASLWVPNQPVIFAGWQDCDSSLIPFYIGEFNGADTMDDGTFQASVSVQWPLIFKSNWYPIQKISEVPSDLEIISQPEAAIGEIAFNFAYGYGIIVGLTFDEDCDDYSCDFFSWHYGVNQCWASSTVCLFRTQSKHLCPDIFQACATAGGDYRSVAIARLEAQIAFCKDQIANDTDPLLHQSRILKCQKSLEFFGISAVDFTEELLESEKVENRKDKTQAELESSPWWDIFKDCDVEILKQAKKDIDRMIRFKQQ